MKGLLCVPIALAVLPSCMTLSSHARLSLDHQGEVYLYVQPAPREAARLSFRLSDVSAVGEDGREFPLLLRVSEVQGRDLARQRLLCSGILPEGSYSGFSFRVTKASLRSEESESALLVPEQPVVVNAPFRVGDRLSSAVFLTFEYERSVREGFGFSPSFVQFSPPKPPVAVLGAISNSGAYSLTLFDKNAMQVVGVVSTGRGPRGVAMDARLRRIYVAVAEEDAVEIYDASSLDRTARIRLNSGDDPQGAGLTADGRTLLVANRGSNTVSVIDTALLMENARLQVGNGPSDVLCDRTGQRAYVFNSLSNTISVIDIANRALIGTLSTETFPVWGQLNAAGNLLYVIHRQSTYLSVFEPLSLALRSRVYVGLGMSALKVDPATDMIYAGRDAGAGIEVYDPLTLVPNGQIGAGGGISSFAIDNEGNALWALSGPGRTARVLNLTSRAVIGEIDTGPEPAWIAMMGER